MLLNEGVLTGIHHSRHVLTKTLSKIKTKILIIMIKTIKNNLQEHKKKSQTPLLMLFIFALYESRI
ncbi:hypothetical protein AHV57_25170 [Salmonella enterica]|nr:hypothetical protein [Salmonella enterica]